MVKEGRIVKTRMRAECTNTYLDPGHHEEVFKPAIISRSSKYIHSEGVYSRLYKNTSLWTSEEVGTGIVASINEKRSTDASSAVSESLTSVPYTSQYAFILKYIANC